MARYRRYENVPKMFTERQKIIRWHFRTIGTISHENRDIELMTKNFHRYPTGQIRRLFRQQKVPPLLGVFSSELADCSHWQAIWILAHLQDPSMALGNWMGGGGGGGRNRRSEKTSAVDPAFFVNADPDPDPGFWWSKIYFDKISIYLYLGLYEGSPSYRRSLCFFNHCAYEFLQEIRKCRS